MKECKYYGECGSFFYGLETHCFHERTCNDFEEYKENDNNDS